ncbi:MAG: RluA family pseudouridine synthase [Anaerolineales bacterium]|nr:RluA family pseudouridine synthase [Anaerolineales bacterium]MCB0011359.1 RluA family pseudouridine synthase [Anaerolineales bacterium]MCB0019452.1 RluA family pseudouridine synthase [Anaerolineales bacterium]MCB8958954.1 RluA family pseudouridine synthase [Ardenticatenales bacterium]
MSQSPQPIELTLHEPDSRLDQALAAALPELSRVQIQRLIKDGQITVDGASKVKASQKLAGGERVTIRLPAAQETDLVAEAIPLDILFEDEDLLVVNKPAGMVVHPAAGHDSGTLVNAVLAHCPDLKGVGGEKRPGIVHRLDKETSGLIIVAKHDQALRYLQDQFRERTIRKTYLALVEGHPEPAEARIDAPIGRDPKARKRMAVIRGGSATAREAQTTYKVDRYYEEHALVRCFPHTGRTHQIRVHMAWVGHPLVGDKVYGRRRPTLPLKRHFLHAAALQFALPASGEVVQLEAPLPADLQSVIDKLEALTL